MKLVIGCDEAGLELKNAMVEHLREMGHDISDFGVYDETPILYPEKAFEVANAVVTGEYERGILVCGTGIGMAIAANKVKGIRAAVCHDIYSAERASCSNDAKIATFGARVVGVGTALKLLDVWLENSFAGNGSEMKVAQIAKYDNERK